MDILLGFIIMLAGGGKAKNGENPYFARPVPALALSSFRFNGCDLSRHK